LGLRDSGAAHWWGGDPCSFGGRLRPVGLRRALSSVHQPVAVRLPERFRGGCAFGVLRTPDLIRGKEDLSRESWPERGGGAGGSQLRQAESVPGR